MTFIFNETLHVCKENLFFFKWLFSYKAVSFIDHWFEHIKEIIHIWFIIIFSRLALDGIEGVINFSLLKTRHTAGMIVRFIILAILMWAVVISFFNFYFILANFAFNSARFLKTSSFIFHLMSFLAFKFVYRKWF